MNNSKLSEKDIISLNKNGPRTEDINKQIDRLSRGNIPVSLIRPATIDDGIIRFSKERRLGLSEKFDEISSDWCVYIGGIWGEISKTRAQRIIDQQLHRHLLRIGGRSLKHGRFDKFDFWRRS